MPCAVCAPCTAGTLFMEMPGLAMLLHQVLVLLAVIAQTDALYAGAVPADVPTFNVTLGSAPPFYAALRIGSAWVMDHRTEIKPTQVVEVIRDDPFHAGEPNRTLMRNIQTVYEPPAMRRKRLQEVWGLHGYTFLETASGWRAVLETDVQKANRAREMAKAVSTSTGAPIDAPSAVTAKEPPAAATRFSANLLWLARAGIVAAVALLLGLIYFFGRSEKSPWTRLN